MIHTSYKTELVTIFRSCFIDNEKQNKEYKACDIDDQHINELNNYTEYLNYW
jgi:hypothetical protein